MRKPDKDPFGQADVLDDNLDFNGLFKYENDFLSDISFYDYDTDDAVEESSEFHSLDENEDKVLSKGVKHLKLSSNKVNKIKVVEKVSLKKIEKGKKSTVESSDESSGSDTDKKLDRVVNHEVLGKHPKSPKKLRAKFSDIEGGAIAQRAGKLKEIVSKRTGGSSLEIDLISGSKIEKTRDLKVKEEHVMESLDDKGLNSVNGKFSVQSFQRRKKLCKAVDLKSAGEKDHKGKGKGYALDARGKIGGKASVMGTLRTNKLDHYSSDSEASPRKNIKKDLLKDHTPCQNAASGRDELGGSKGLAKKKLSSPGHITKIWEPKQEDVAGSSSSGRQHGPSENLIPLISKSKKKTGHATKDLCVSVETVHSSVDPQKHALEKVCDNGLTGEEVSSGVTEGAEGNKGLVPGDNVDEATGDAKNGWVMCDSCKKWRCIPSALIDIIESTNSGWLCKDNPNKKFADCAVPQEKTNIEINRELNLSEVSFCEEGDEKNPAIDSASMNDIEHQSQLQSTWTLIKHNIFQHRQRKVETLDEQMICSCTPPEDGGPGCGDDCHNRMLNIECVSQTCPCGDACSNQQFQRRLYKKVNWFRCGKKGFGLQVLEDVSKGSFIIEYVGEVLNVASYEARQREYAERGQKHFYFMTLSGSEIIDACYKGNLGRFINHSCDPNCRTEKWMVNGEVCIGLFAIRDLKKGEELTFDYNFVRACGAAAKKCLCGSRNCRGFIGGDLNSQCVVHSDSDEDFPEPIMIEASSEEESRTEDSKVAARKKLDDKVEISSPSELLSKQTDWNEVTERQGSSVKQSKVKSGVKTLSSVNLRRLTTDRDGGHFEGVEEELNKLVDENGSLRKGQPAVATTYLKLLVRTSASSAMAAEGSRSIRDISLVLDALLKTQSRAILLEISSIHGFQVLHKMLKQSKKDYKRTPIIRKLLKVLEFLAARRILTMEQINAEPSRSDMESVKDTIFGLCRHGDVEVQKMARHFKDKYLKASSQKLSRRGQGPSDLSKWRLFHKQTQQGSSGAEAVADDNTKKRKRASRWDQPSQEVLDTTTAGGLPQSFWPFNANNLLVGNSQQSDGADPQVRQNEGASRDEFGALHPGPPLTDKHPPDVAPVTPGVVSGIPVEQFSAGTSMGYMAQQGPICFGIPVSQFHSGSTPLEFPYVPQIVASTCQVAHPHGEQVSPLSSNPANMQDHIQHKTDGQSKNKIIEESKMTFGISHSQFFRQMHGMFGSTFHPWQLQSLMAAHAWGPFLAGDARIREYNNNNNNNNNDPGMPFRQPNQYRGTEESVSKPLERSGGVGYAPEVEPCVPGLSPPLPPPLPQLAQPPLPVQTPKHTDNQPFIADERLGRINIQHQQFKPTSWRPHQRWNSPKWPKFQGNNRNRSPGVRRDHNYMQRPYRPNFGRQGGHMRPHNWEGSSPWKHSDRNWGFSDAQGMDQETSTEVLDGGQNATYGSPYQDTGNSSGSMPLEKPWGYGQQYPNGDPNNYSANVPQEGVNDTFNSWGANNQ